MAKSISDLQKILVQLESSYRPPTGGPVPITFWGDVESTVRLELLQKIQEDVRNRVSSLGVVELGQLLAMISELRTKGVLPSLPAEPVPAVGAPQPPEPPKPTAAAPQPKNKGGRPKKEKAAVAAPKE